MFRFGYRRTPYLAAATVVASVLLTAPPAGADVDVAQGGAFGVVVTGFLGAIPPTPAVALTADETSPPAALGPFNAQAPGASLPGFAGLFSTGPLTVSAAAGGLAGENHAGFVEARASAQNVTAGGNLATAASIASSCRASGDGSTGTTVIQGAVLNGQPFANGTPPPNTVISVPGIGTVTLNEQVRSDVPGEAGIIVNAVHARYASGPGGILPQDQSAEAIIGQVMCRVAGPDVNVPITTTTMTATTTATPRPTAAPPPAGVPVATVAPRSLPSTGSAPPLGPGMLVLGAAVALRLVIRSGGPTPAGVGLSRRRRRDGPVRLAGPARGRGDDGRPRGRRREPG